MQKIKSIRVNDVNSSNLKSFKELFLKELKFAYWSEKQLLKLLQRLSKASCTRYLKAAFKGHCLATQEHVLRIERIFVTLNEKNLSKRSEEMDGLISAAAGVIKSTGKNTLSRDLGLIDVAEKIAKVEIHSYNKLINFSNELGNFELTLLLEETLMEEQEAGETFDALMEDTLRDELFKIKNEEFSDEPVEESEELEAV